MFIQKQNFIFNCKEQDGAFIESLNIQEIYEKVKNFFNFKNNLLIKVNFLYTVNEFNFFNKNQFKEWMCGFTGFPNMIFIFSPSIIETLTIHKKQDIPKIITHELSHIFYGNMKLPQIPLFNEGIATYLSFYDREIIKEDNKKINLPELVKMKNSKEIYPTSFTIIKKIIDQFGKEKLFLFLEKLKEDNENFSEKFESVFGVFIKENVG